VRKDHKRGSPCVSIYPGKKKTRGVENREWDTGGENATRSVKMIKGGANSTTNSILSKGEGYTGGRTRNFSQHRRNGKDSTFVGGKRSGFWAAFSRGVAKVRGTKRGKGGHPHVKRRPRGKKTRKSKFENKKGEPPKNEPYKR